LLRPGDHRVNIGHRGNGHDATREGDGRCSWCRCRGRGRDSRRGSMARRQLNGPCREARRHDGGRRRWCRRSTT
jgi:hypothetical protein